MGNNEEKKDVNQLNDEIKKDDTSIEGESQEKTDTNAKKGFDSKLILIIVLLVLVIAMAFYIFILKSKTDDNGRNVIDQDNTVNSENNGESNNQDEGMLSLDDKIVVGAYEKLPRDTINSSTGWADLTNSNYLSTKQSYETLQKNFIMNHALLFVDGNDFEIVEGMEPGSELYKLKKSVIEENIKNIYSDVEFDFETYNVENGITSSGGDVGGGLLITNPSLYCNKYVEEEYWCYPYNMGGAVAVSSMFFRNLVSAELVDDYLYLYDYQFKLMPIWSEEGDNLEGYGVYPDEFGLVGTITEDEHLSFESKKAEYDSIVQKFGDKLKLYKHTFKKDNNGNYYWVSTEQEKR